MSDFNCFGCPKIFTDGHERYEHEQACLAERHEEIQKQLRFEREMRRTQGQTR